jgi:Flp pilus assembly protein TadD
MDVFARFRTALDGSGRQQRARALVQSGTAHLMSGNAHGAEGDLRRAVELDPVSTAAHGYLGLALFKLEEYAAADEELCAAIRLAPADESLHIMRGQLLEAMERLEDARNELTTASTVDSASVRGLVALAGFELRQSDMATSERLVVQALRRDERDVEGWRVFSAIREIQGDLASAIQSMEWVVSLRPDDSGNLCRLASLLEISCNEDRAIDLLQAAHRSNQLDYEVLQSLCVALTRRGRELEAEALYDAAIDLSPPDMKRSLQAQLMRLKSEFGDLAAAAAAKPSAKVSEACSTSSGGDSATDTSSTPPPLTDEGHGPATPVQADIELRVPIQFPLSAGPQTPASSSAADSATAASNPAVAVPENRSDEAAAVQQAQTSHTVQPPARRTATIAQVEYAVSRDPSNSKLRRDLSILYLQAGRLAEAKDQARRAEALQSKKVAR